MSELGNAVVLLSGTNPDELAEVASGFAECKAEATIVFSGQQATELAASKHPLIHAGRTLDSGLKGLSPQHFLSAEEPSFDQVLFATARVPSCYVCPKIEPTSYAVLSEWNVHGVIAPEFPWQTKVSPFFIGGRLHLASAGKSAVHIEKISSADAGRVIAAAKLGAPVCVTIAGGDKAQTVTFVEGLREAKVGVQSFRQFADEYADVPYDHAVPFAAITAMAKEIVTNEAHAPYRYEIGYFSPAEQLFLLTSAWVSAIEKGKAPRNAQARTPIPAFTSTDEPPGSVMQFADAINAAFKMLQGTNTIPTHIQTPLGLLLAADFAAVLAANIDKMPSTEHFQHAGALMTDNDMADAGPYRELMWTYKPAVK